MTSAAMRSSFAGSVIGFPRASSYRNRFLPPSRRQPPRRTISARLNGHDDHPVRLDDDRPRSIERAHAVEPRPDEPLRRCDGKLADELARGRVGSKPEEQRQAEHRRARRPRLGSCGCGIGDRERRVRTGEAREDLRQRVVERRGSLDQAGREELRLGPEAGTRETPRCECSVMGPDRAVVVAERVVGTLPRAHGAYAPAGPEVVTGEGCRDGAAPLLGNDSGPQEVSDVRAERVDLLLASVERERVGLALFDPEGSVESLRERRAIRLEPVRELGLVPYGTRQLGYTETRVVGVALHLDRRDWRHRDPAIGKALRVARVLP